MKDELITRIFKSWKSSTVGVVVSTVLSFVLFEPKYFEHWPIIISIAKFATIGGLAIFHISQKDIVQK